MRPLPRRMPSKSAKWALRIAIFVPVLALLSVLAHRSGSVETPSFLVLLGTIALCALIAFLFVIAAFRSLWVKGKRGGRRATWALFIVAVIAAPYLYAAALSITRPQVIDVSTDLVDPPVFQAEAQTLGENASTIIAGSILDGYPEITGRRYNAAADSVIEQVLQVASNNSWLVTARSGRVGADDEFTLEFSHKSRILGMPTEIIVRVTDEGETTYLDVRSKSLFVSHDLGSNAGIIRQLIADVDFNLAGQIIQ